jgi:hypothetical protein
MAIVECRGIDKRLERRTRLADGLRRAIELGLVEGKTADHDSEHAPSVGSITMIAPLTSGLAQPKLRIPPTGST